MNYEKSDLTDGSKWTPVHLTVVLSSAICFFLLLIGCSDVSNDGNTTNIDNNDSLEQEVNDLVAQMSGDKTISLPGGGSLWNVPGLERLDIPPLKMSDGPRGVTAALGATTFPVGIARGATWDSALEQRVGAAMGRELKAIGGNVLLPPTINILRHPSWGRSQETYSEDVYLLSQMGIASIQGVQEYLLANPKHYTANSIEDTRFDAVQCLYAGTSSRDLAASIMLSVAAGQAVSLQ